VNSEAMQVVSLMGGPADGIVTVVPSSQSSLAIQQPGTPDQGTIVGRYSATSGFSLQGYPAWEWAPEATGESR
jgi:hypothetical protein